MKFFYKSMTNKVLGIGNALVDILVSVDNDLLLNELNLPKGSMQLIEQERYQKVQMRFADLSPRRSTGGSACNTILAIATLDSLAGGVCEGPGLIGKVGCDGYGDFFNAACRERKVQTHLLRDAALPTGVASTVITPDGQRTFATYLGAAVGLTASDLRTEWFEGYSYLYLEGYLVQNHALISRAIELARLSGLKVCIDLASYNIVSEEKAFFQMLLAQTDLVFANEQEAAAFTGDDDAERNVEALARLCEIAVVKVGKQGAWVCSKGVKLHCPACEVPVVVDTTAAGDYFSAGFLYALSQGKDLLSCARLGSLLSGRIIGVIGTALSGGTWKEIQAEMQHL